jgi:hypothetical protein
MPASASVQRRRNRAGVCRPVLRKNYEGQHGFTIHAAIRSNRYSWCNPARIGEGEPDASTSTRTAVRHTIDRNTRVRMQSPQLGAPAPWGPARGPALRWRNRGEFQVRWNICGPQDSTATSASDVSASRAPVRRTSGCSRSRARCSPHRACSARSAAACPPQQSLRPQRAL